MDPNDDKLTNIHYFVQSEGLQTWHSSSKHPLETESKGAYFRNAPL